MYFLFPDRFCETNALTNVVKKISSQVDTLDMSNNINLKRHHSDLDFVAAIPASVHTFNMADNSLAQHPAENLSRCVGNLPKTISALGLARNYLSNKTTDELISIFKQLPANIKVLDISGNEFSNKPGKELQQVFAALSYITKLNLGKTYCVHRSLSEIAYYVSIVPRKLTDLDLSGIGLICKEGKDNELADVISKAPANLIHFGLANNQLGYNNSNALALGIASLPKTLQSLDVSDNRLDLLNEAHLTRAFAKIPASVNHINFNGNFEGTPEQVEQKLFRIVPLTVTSIYINDKRVTRSSSPSNSDSESLDGEQARFFTPAKSPEPGGGVDDKRNIPDPTGTGLD